MGRNIIILVSLVCFINSCRIFKPEVSYTYNAIWNKNSKTFEKAPVQLGCLTPDFYVESYKKSGDTIIINADLDPLQIHNLNSTRKLLIECNKDGGIVDTVLIFTNEQSISFKYKKRKGHFFILKEESKTRGAYFTDRAFRNQGKNN